MANIYFCFCPKWAAECQRYFGDSTDITDVFQDYVRNWWNSLSFWGICPSPYSCIFGLHGAT